MYVVMDITMYIIIHTLLCIYIHYYTDITMSYTYMYIHVHYYVYIYIQGGYMYLIHYYAHTYIHVYTLLCILY